MTKTKKELEEELEELNKIEKIMDVQDKVKAKRLELIKRKYTGVKALLRFFVK